MGKLKKRKGIKEGYPLSCDYRRNPMRRLGTRQKSNSVFLFLQVYKRQSLCTTSQKMGVITKTQHENSTSSRKQMEESGSLQAGIPCALWQEKM